VFFDAIIFVGGSEDSYTKSLKMGRLVHAVRESFMHLKTIGATGNAVPWVMDMCLPGEFDPSIKESTSIALEKGVLLAPSPGLGAEFAAKFLTGVKAHRVWDREVSHIAA
jgi:catalase